MSEAPLNWVKEIHSTLIEAGTIPLSGYAPPFPWEGLSQKIGALLQSSEFKIFPRKTSFLNGNDIGSGLGTGFISVALDLTPLNGQAFWLMGKEDVAKLTALALAPSQAGKGLSSQKFQEGFYYFLGTQIVQAISEMNPFGDLALKIARPAAPPQEEALCIDVQIEHSKQTFWGRLVCPASFHQAFKSHFSTQQPPPLTSAIARQIDVTLRLQLGQAELALSQFKKVKVGDFILLDRCTFDPKTLKGTATLMLEQTPILRARIKDNSLKIVDYAYYREEQNQMNPDKPQDEETPEENFENEELSSAEFEGEGTADENHLWSSQNGGVEKLIAPSEIPLTLSIEVARLSINLEKLLQLSPGNVLELPVRPEQGVDIVVGGKKVAKAELVKLGEMLGVKILQLGE